MEPIPMKTKIAAPIKNASSKTRPHPDATDVFAVAFDPALKPEADRAEKLTQSRIRREEETRAAALAEFMRLAEAD